MCRGLSFSATVVAAAIALIGAGTASPGQAWADGKDLDGVVNLNTAGAEVLELLPGIGPAKVRSIVAYRQRRPFRTVDELVRIKGIGRKMVRRLRVHLAVSGPTTARALHRERGAEPPPVPPPPPPRRPAPPAGAPAAFAARCPTGPPAVVGHGRPRPLSAAERAPSRADHCRRPP